MRALPILLLVGITMSVAAPAAAQRFAGNAPVCMQKWQWGGSATLRANCFVGRMSSDRCGPFRDVPFEPLCSAAVSAGAQSAFPINAVAAAVAAVLR